jgi:hypothetical protein
MAGRGVKYDMRDGYKYGQKIEKYSLFRQKFENRVHTKALTHSSGKRKRENTHSSGTKKSKSKNTSLLESTHSSGVFKKVC